MAKAEIMSVGTEIPGDVAEYVPFNSSRSLLDADIILFEPRLDYDTDRLGSTYQGKPSLSDRSSVQTRAAIKHWRSELKHAIEAGKTIFIFLPAPEEVYANTGTQEFSGTGRNQKVIRHVGTVNNYEALPITFSRLIPATGTKVKLTNEGSFLATYWKAMADYSSYEVRYEMEQSTPLMLTQAGNHCVASMLKGKTGNVIVLPMLEYDEDEFHWINQHSYNWTKEAIKWGKSLITCLVEIHRALRSTAGRTPAPGWSKSDVYTIQTEIQILKHISKIDTTTLKLAEERRELSQELDRESLPRALLYESGKALEAAVIDALRTLGFEAENYTDDSSEFDVVFIANEGRFLGEVEGRNNAPININKLQQLERNIQEDFARPDVNAYAKGVLFGNPHRLT
ncbi:MAG: hypothetical protein OXI35_16495, partial [Gemmatimonadota bacterium]|nr:hypothetical protein [Gemmatimonadota bacterium]